MYAQLCRAPSLPTFRMLDVLVKKVSHETSEHEPCLDQLFRVRNDLLLCTTKNEDRHGPGFTPAARSLDKYNLTYGLQTCHRQLCAPCITHPLTAAATRGLCIED